MESTVLQTDSGKDFTSNEAHFARFAESMQGKNGHAAEAQAPTPQVRRTKKIAIIGRAPSSVLLAPYDDPEVEVWTLGNAAISPSTPSGQQKGVPDLPRWDRLFELHNFDEKRDVWPKSYWEWLGNDHGKPVYIAEPHPHIPHGTVYPWDTVFQKFGRYFNNSISLMIAVALLEGVTEMFIYGVDMAQSDPALHNGNPEYQHQRPSCEFMIGVAAGLGVRVVVPPESDLLKCANVYAYPGGRDPELMAKLRARKKELQGRRDVAMQNHANLKSQANQWEKAACKFEGALEDVDWMIQRSQA